MLKVSGVNDSHLKIRQPLSTSLYTLFLLDTVISVVLNKLWKNLEILFQYSDIEPYCFMYFVKWNNIFFYISTKTPAAMEW